MKGLKRKCPSTGGGVFSRTRARKAVSNGNEPVREESNPVRGTTVVSLSLDTETEGMSAVSSKCRVKKTVDVIKELKEEVGWFTSHSQFCHFFHMPDEEFLKLQGMWMLLLRTIRIEGEDAAWFAVNGYPSGHLKLGSTKIVDYYFGNKKKITIEDVKQKLQSTGTACNDRLKMAVLFFLGRVIRGKTKDSAALDPFILRIVDDLDVCRKFPWGRLTFEDAIT
ncbi:hypothetical protein BRARA_H00767 [Brassica rapa]|uniref:DUF1985 domain-containing protein n=1 Tax=Brassica campestris TaxID=3711 RepID=A0A397YAV5_BRACM|nr:hypothetical protein BRARA_H00767 [Brassica rapa]